MRMAQITTTAIQSLWRRYGLISLLLLGVAALRLWNLQHSDLTGDPAYSSFMSLGWLDFVGQNNQTSPIVWFGYIPWWGVLSFSGKPLLGFLVQYIFFKLFGESSFVALLPFPLI